MLAPSPLPAKLSTSPLDATNRSSFSLRVCCAADGDPKSGASASANGDARRSAGSERRGRSISIENLPRGVAAPLQGRRASLARPVERGPPSTARSDAARRARRRVLLAPLLDLLPEVLGELVV